MCLPAQAYFEGLLISGVLALRREREQLESLLAIAMHSDFPCMEHVDKATMLQGFRDRLMVRVYSVGYDCCEQRACLVRL